VLLNRRHTAKRLIAVKPLSDANEHVTEVLENAVIAAFIRIRKSRSGN